MEIIASIAESTLANSSRLDVSASSARFLSGYREQRSRYCRRCPRCALQPLPFENRKRVFAIPCLARLLQATEEKEEVFSQFRRQHLSQMFFPRNQLEVE
jgi:hypothetical protein